MSSQANRQVRLESRPTGIPQPDHFEIVTAPLPDISDRQFLVCNEYLRSNPLCVDGCRLSQTIPHQSVSAR